MIQSLENKIDKDRMPKHVAIIMDGNGRWAKKQGLKRTFGHQNAVESVRSSIQACEDLGIKYLTLFAFSTENWHRPRAEISFLMTLLSKTIKAELKELHEKGIRIRTIGDIEALPEAPKKALKKAIETTKDNQNANLILALNYGSRTEKVRAARLIGEEISKGTLNSSEIDSTVFEQFLYTKDFPEVDLLIRTSGEQRISNFLLWQLAYAELYFTDVLWPDFRKPHFLEAVKNYASRERRYGKTGEQIKTE